MHRQSFTMTSSPRFCGMKSPYYVDAGEKRIHSCRSWPGPQSQHEWSNSAPVVEDAVRNSTFSFYAPNGCSYSGRRGISD